jgi:uncharacterized repeat protein (TIGR01451 family)
LNYPVGSSPRSLVAADFNGDGATDLAVANSTGSSVSVLLGIPLPVLQITSAHTDPFGQGQAGASYTIVVTNSGPNPTGGTVTMSDTLPVSLKATAISGTGWACSLSTLTCTISDALPAGASYPAVVVTVNVSSNAPASVINQVKVSGGSAVGASAADPTTISFGPPITIDTNPEGLQFTIDGGPSLTSPITRYLNPGSHIIAAANLQPGTAGTQYVFTGWSDAGTATHNIDVGSSAVTYTATFQTQFLLTVAPLPLPGGTVSPVSGGYVDAGTVVRLTASPISPYVFASWSGSVTGASNPTQITMNGPMSVTANFDVPGFSCAITGDGTASLADVQFMVNEALGAAAPNHDLNRDNVVNVSDVQKVIAAALGAGCIY